MSATAIREHAPTAPRIVPPPLRGWLVVFALHRVYLVASSAHYLARPMAFWQSGPSLAAWQEQARRSMMITAIWLVVDLIGLVLLLRRDHRAPVYWMGRLTIGVAWFAMNVLPRLDQGLHLPVTSWALAVGLPVLWLALWLRSPLVARTFGPAAERWWAPPRAPSSGLTVSGLLLAALWLCLFAAGWVFAGAGEWKLAVFFLYSLLALPLWVVTWAWGRQAGSAIAGWFPLVWIAVALEPYMSRAGDVSPRTQYLFRSLDLTSGVQTVAFALALYIIVRGLRGPLVPVTAPER